MTAEEVQSILAYMLSAWPGANVDQGTPLVWADNLAGISYEVATSTAKKLVRESQWFPSISEFLAVARIERLSLGAAPSRDTYECRVCLAGRGFIVTDEEPMTGHPCPECRPLGYQKWAAGAYLPDHRTARTSGERTMSPERFEEWKHQALAAACERAQIAKKLAAKAGTTGGAHG